MSDEAAQAVVEETADYEANVDKLLAGILEDSGDPGDVYGEEQQEPDTPTPEPDAEDVSDVTPSEFPSEEEEGEEKTGSSPSESSIPEADLNRAYEALMRDYGKREADSLLETWGEERFVANGLKRADTQRELDARLTQPKKEATPEQEESNAVPAAETPSVSVRDLARPLAEQLGLGDDGLAALVDFQEKANQAVLAPLTQKVQAYEQVLGVLGRAVEDLSLERARETLSLPELEGDLQTRVKARFDELAASKLHSDKSGVSRVQALLRAAIQLEDPNLLASKEAEAEKRRKRRNGSATRPKATTEKRSQPVSREDRVDATLEAIFDGKSLEEIRGS